MKEVIIVGAGLSGLVAAYYLKKSGIDVLVLEGRKRWGGRILTDTAGDNDTPVEMGATWFGDKHLYFNQLLTDLEISFFKQYQKGVGIFESGPAGEIEYFRMPDTEEPSYRVAGGTAKLINALVDKIGKEQILLDSPVAKVSAHSAQNDYIQVRTRAGEMYACRNLVITIPPFLIIAQDIQFNPVLPPDLVSVMANTHTWMGDAIKFAVAYATPFWRQQGYSGSAFSSLGIAPEMYDHSNVEETRFSLKGFLSPDAANLAKPERTLRVIEQLTRLFGKAAANYLSYTEKIWKNDVYTYADYGKYVMPHQHNGHAVYSRPLMNGKLYLAGTETSPKFGGYMDGAVYSGLTTAKRILDQVNKV